MAGAATEIERLLVRLVGDDKLYIKTLDQATSATTKFVRDANGQYRDLKGKFVSGQKVMQHQVEQTILKLKAYGNSLDILGTKMMRVGDVARTVGRNLSIFVTAPLIAAAVIPLKVASNFESSFAGIRKTVKATEAEFAELATGMRGLALRIPVDVNELNQIGEAAGQLGIQRENILKFTETMANLGVATNLSSLEAASALAKFTNITGLSENDVDRLGSTIVALGNNFATTERDITEFGVRMAGAGALAGLTDAQILAVGTALSSVGVEAEAGGTAVQKVLLDMTQAVAQGNDQLDVFAKTAGMSSKDFADAFKKDAGDAFTKFVEGLGTQGDKAFETLAKLGFEDQRLLRSFLSLANSGDLLSDAMQTATQAFAENTALTTEAEERYKTFDSQLQLLKNRFKDQAITLGQSLLPVAKDLLVWLEGASKALQGAVKWFSELDRSTKNVVIGVLAIVAALGPLSLVIGGVVSSIGYVVSAFGAMLTGIKSTMSAVSILSKVGLAGLTIGVGALVAALIYNLHPATQAVNQQLADMQNRSSGLSNLTTKKFTEQLSGTSQLPADQRKSALEGMKAKAQEGLGVMQNEIGKFNTEVQKLQNQNVFSRVLDAHGIKLAKQHLEDARAKAKEFQDQVATLDAALAGLNKGGKEGAGGGERSQEATDAINNMLKGMERQVETFGLEGPAADIANLMAELKESGANLTGQEALRLQLLEAELKKLEEQKQAQEEQKKVMEEQEQVRKNMEQRALQLMNEQLTPLEKLKRDNEEILKLQTAGFLTAQQAQRLIEGKTKAFTDSQNKSAQPKGLALAERGSVAAFQQRVREKNQNDTNTLMKRHIKVDEDQLQTMEEINDKLDFEAANLA